MNGAGNDFVMVDNRDGSRSLDRSQIERLCDRHRGIGGDGLIALEGTPELPRMRYYNADGGEAEMCGNGARCFARYTARLLGQSSGVLSFSTQAGMIAAELLPDQRIRLRMSEPHSLQLAHSLKVENADLEVHSLNTGVPPCGGLCYRTGVDSSVRSRPGPPQSPEVFPCGNERQLRSGSGPEFACHPYL